MVQRPPGNDDPIAKKTPAPVNGTSTEKRPLDPETTLDLLKALENAAIVIEEPAPRAPEPHPEPSYNPYDRAPAKPRRKQ